MPRDKTATHKKLLSAIKDEFLRLGYEKASLKNIAAISGITPAGIYRHFENKQAMFKAMVEPVTGEFFKTLNVSMHETYEKIGQAEFKERFNDFRAEKNREFLSFMYDHYDVFRLLLVCSKGTEYENFEEKLIEMEVESILDLFLFMDKKGISHNQVTKEELHILCTSLVTAVCETVRHGYDRMEAFRYLDFIEKMFYPGMKEILGL